MSRTHLIAVASLTLLSGCTTLTPSGAMTVRPATAEEAWTISASSVTGWFDDDITLFVDGQPVATGTLSPSDHHGVHITGDYGHHIVLGICSRTDASPIVYSCDLYVDGYASSTLRWQE